MRRLGETADAEIRRLRLDIPPEPPLEAPIPAPEPPPTPLPPVDDAHRRQMLEALHRLAPPAQVAGVYPGTGTLRPLPLGMIDLNFRDGLAVSPLGAEPLNMPERVLTKAQSLYIYADGSVYVAVDPGLGQFPLDGGIEIPARHVERIRITSFEPWGLLVIAGTAPLAPLAHMVQAWSFRHSLTTLTKVNAAGVDDAQVPVAFVPAYVTVGQVVETIDQAVWGSTMLPGRYRGTKTCIIRNMGPGAANVQLFGTGAQWVAGLTRWVADPDTGATDLDIPADTDAILETGLPYGAVQLHARVAAAEAPAVTAELRIEYISMAPSTR